ncbi:MAG: O-antigen ligase family protein [Bacillales bacterium]|nr:O-antigen ligase family protein [Bacillales bacterium]
MKKIIYYLFLILPFIDLITSFTERINGNIVSIGTIFKGILILFSGIYILFITKSKYKKKSIIYYLLLSIFSIIHILIGNNSYVSSVTQLIKFMFLPIIFIFLLNYNDDYKISYIEMKKILKYNVFFILTTILIAKLTNTGFNSYSDTVTTGVVGWYYSANEISGIITILFPLFLEDILKNNKYSFILVMYVIFMMMMLGTKTPLLGVLISLIALFIHILLKDKNKKNIFKIVFFISYTVILFFNSSYLSNLNSGRYISTTNAVFSSRDIYLNNTTREYINHNLEKKLFGLGSTNNKVLEKYVEMDFYDLLYRYGIIGFIIFMIPFFKIVLKMMEYALSHLNNYNYDKMILILITMLSLLIAFFAGHILSAPAVSIYFGITIILYMNIDKETL